LIRDELFYIMLCKTVDIGEKKGLFSGQTSLFLLKISTKFNLAGN